MTNFNLPPVLTVEQMRNLYPNKFLKVKVVSVDANRNLVSGIVLADGETLAELADNRNSNYDRYYKYCFVYNTTIGYHNPPAMRAPHRIYYD